MEKWKYVSMRATMECQGGSWHYLCQLSLGLIWGLNKRRQQNKGYWFWNRGLRHLLNTSIEKNLMQSSSAFLLFLWWPKRMTLLKLPGSGFSCPLLDFFLFCLVTVQNRAKDTKLINCWYIKGWFLNVPPEGVNKEPGRGLY